MRLSARGQSGARAYTCGVNEEAGAQYGILDITGAAPLDVAAHDLSGRRVRILESAGWEIGQYRRT